MTPQADSVLELFRSRSAYLQGHFRLTSGLHSSAYLQSALVLQDPDAAERLGKMLAGLLRDKAGSIPSFVAAPALGGLIIGHEVARELRRRFLFTEREASTGKMTLRRGFEVTPGETAVVVEDVVTTGGSTREVIELLQAAGVRVLAAGSLIDRSGGEADVGVPRVALATLEVATYPPDFCPLCAQGTPAVKPGSRPV